MNQEYALALVQQMVQIPSVSGEESALATYLAGEMNSLGFHSYIDGAGNVVGEKGSENGPTIMLLGHMDTISDLFEGRREGSLLYGRGAVDAKGSLATLICAATQVPDMTARVIVVGAVEEETPGSRGAHYLLGRYAPDAVIIGEPSGCSNVVLGYKGRMGLIYDVCRPLSHTAGPGEKATEVGVEFWNRLIQYLTTTSEDRSFFNRATATLGQFEGNIQQARLEISCRTPPNFDFRAFEEFLATILLDAQLHVDERTPCVLMERNAPTVRALSNSIRAHGGRPKLKVKTGTSDMNIVNKRWKVPMAAYGPGDSNLDHTSNEHLDLDEYLAAIDVLSDALPPLAAELSEMRTENIYTSEEEAEISQRLEALGYLE